MHLIRVQKFLLVSTWKSNNAELWCGCQRFLTWEDAENAFHLCSFVTGATLMCGHEKNGGRARCESSYSYASASKLNANRRTARLARRRLAQHLRELGMTATATTLMATPPSVLPALMSALDIDESVLGGVRMPSDRRRAASATKVIAIAVKERADLAATSTASVGQAVRQIYLAMAPREAIPANINCRSEFDTVRFWEDQAERIFTSGTMSRAREACAEVGAFCKGCPLVDRCAETARDTRYTGMAGGRVFVDGRHRVSPSHAARIVA